MLATYGLQRSHAVAQVVDPYFASVKLLLHFDGGETSTYFQDLSPSPLLGTVSAGPTITAVNRKFGNGCGDFTGTGYVSYNDTQRFAPSASENFTIECWFKTTSAASLRNIVSVYEQTIGKLGWMIRMSDGAGSNGAGTKIAFNSSIYGGSETYVSSTTSINDGNWHFLQIVRESGVLKLRLDGIEEANTSFPSAYTAVTDLRIGYQGATQGNNWVGQIDDFRFTRGVARPNVVPTTAFPNL
jgi:hypothetical protein